MDLSPIFRRPHPRWGDIRYGGAGETPRRCAIWTAPISGSSALADQAESEFWRWFDSEALSSAAVAWLYLIGGRHAVRPRPRHAAARPGRFSDRQRRAAVGNRQIPAVSAHLRRRGFDADVLSSPGCGSRRLRRRIHRSPPSCDPTAVGDGCLDMASGASGRRVQLRVGEGEAVARSTEQAAMFLWRAHQLREAPWTSDEEDQS